MLPDKAITAILDRLNRLVEIEERRERRLKWTFLWSIVKAFLLILLPVGAGYYIWIYLEDQLPHALSSITSALRLPTKGNGGLPISPDVLQQIQGVLGR